MFFDPAVTGIAAFLVVFTGLIVLGFFFTHGRRGKLSKVLPRLRELSATARPPPRPARPGGAVLRPLLGRLASAVGAARLAELRTQCLQAGYFHPGTPTMFVAVRLLLTLTLAGAGALVALYGGILAANGAKPAAVFGGVPVAGNVATFALAGCAVGFLAPALWLSARVRARQRSLRHALPDALDMLILCVEGGMGVNAAVQRVTDELQLAHPLLALEMNIVQREMQLGLSAGEALRKFGDRCGLADVRDLALVLLQSEQYGASVTKALRGYVESTRLERQQQAEEVAQKAAVKILFPTMLCIFPAIFVVVLGPAAFQMAKLFAH